MTTIRRRRRRGWLVLGVLVLVVAGVLLLRRQEILFAWNLRQLAAPGARFVSLSINGSLPPALEELERWFLEHPELCRRLLPARLTSADRYGKLVALDLLEKVADDQGEDADEEWFRQAFFDPSSLDQPLADVLIYAREPHVHGVFETGALLLENDVEATTLWHVAVLDRPGVKDAEEGSLAAARDRFSRERRATVRRWRLEGEERQAMLGPVTLALCLPEFPELESSRTGGFCHLIDTAGREVKLWSTGWPWLERLATRLRDLARGVGWRDSAEPPSSRDSAAFLRRALGMAPRLSVVEHVVTAMSELEDIPSRASWRAEIEETWRIPAGKGGTWRRWDAWIAVAVHLLGDSTKLRGVLANLPDRWPPLDDPRLGFVLARRPHGVLPPFLLRCVQAEPARPFAYELAALTLDAFEDPGLTALLEQVTASGEVELRAFLEQAASNPQACLGDAVFSVLEAVPGLAPGDYIRLAASRLGLPGAPESSWEDVYRQLAALPSKDRLGRLTRWLAGGDR